MAKNNRIIKGFMLAGWIILGVGLLVLLVAAMRSSGEKNCRDIVITISGARQTFFVDRYDVGGMLNRGGVGSFRGKPLKSFDLREMEAKLERNPWISEAELYFDNNNVLHVEVKETEPVARVFTVKGQSYYIDSNLRQLPLSAKFSPRLPVFTGFPAEGKKPAGRDSALLQSIRDLAVYIRREPFWLAQIEQVDITPERTFEMVPKVGDHLVLFGEGEHIPEKFRRLGIFYREVLSKTGWNRYSLVNVQYKGQVVATRRDEKPHRPDTVSVRQWMKQWQQSNLQIKAADSMDGSQAVKADSAGRKPDVSDTPDRKPETARMKGTSVSRQKQTADTAAATRKPDAKPKALMPPADKQKKENL